MEIRINKQYIHSKEDFIKYLKENSNDKDFEPNISDEKKIYESIILVKNYITVNDFNNILNLEMFKYSLNKITKINLTANNLTSVPDIFKSLSNIKILILNNNQIEKISNLENLTKLEKLELRSNKLTKIENLNNLQNLQKLTLSCNLISNVDENDLPVIDTLTEFGLFGNYLGVENKKYDKDINDKNIQLLKNFSNMIKIKFKNLKGLYIGGNFFTNLISNSSNNSSDGDGNYKYIVNSIIPGIIIDGQS
jgi:Leucine-rich repeat (LRR) protein